MIKELILAIILGCLLGFGLTGGYIAVKKNKPTSVVATISPIVTQTENQKTSPAPSPTTDQNESQKTGTNQLSITSPENESVTTSSKVSIKGSTTALSSIIITTNANSYLGTADNSGNFNIEIEVDSGPNLIQVNSIDTSDNQSTASLLVTYSTAKF